MTCDLRRVLRAKGIVEARTAYGFILTTSSASDIRRGMPGVTGKYCVIGANLAEEKIEAFQDRRCNMVYPYISLQVFLRAARLRLSASRLRTRVSTRERTLIIAARKE